VTVVVNTEARFSPIHRAVLRGAEKTGRPIGLVSTLMTAVFGSMITAPWGAFLGALPWMGFTALAYPSQRRAWHHQRGDHGSA